MELRRKAVFETIRATGGLLPVDILQRVAALDQDLPGLTPSDYHLAEGERLNDAINRSWKRLQGVWRSFQKAIAGRPDSDVLTGPTREKWLQIVFQELGYGHHSRTGGLALDGKAYSISHAWHAVPIHLVGWRVDLDRRQKGVEGAAHASPHGLVQEYLNRSDDHLWGIVSNGRALRLLRDNVRLTRQAYVEFDLQGMMDGEVFADFRVLWLVAHESSFEGKDPGECRAEKWHAAAGDEGTRALDRLRVGVESAIQSLGTGFLLPANTALRDRLKSGDLSTQDYYRQLLRVAYRLIFLFVAEDRDLLLDPDADDDARERYRRWYSTRRVRDLAGHRRGSRHRDLWRGLALVMEKLGGDGGCPELALNPLGSFLWDRESVEALAGADLSNADLLDAVHHLCWVVDGGVRRPVDYAHLGPEELGSIYESLLELHPELNLEAGTFELRTAAGHERKTTGSYYTPESLVQCLLDTALDPVLDEAAKKDDPEAAILGLKVCDPACGSGHFLIAAAHRIAKRLASVRTDEQEPSPEAIGEALRDVVGRCLYGVDRNPMAVELCKVSLWMEALVPGRPLSFLDHHVQVGDSLLGTTPKLLAGGLPDAAFTAIEGDDKEVVKGLKRQNREERRDRQKTMFGTFAEGKPIVSAALAKQVETIEELDDSELDAVHRKEALFEKLRGSEAYRHARLLADAWCAAFVWRKTKDAPAAITHDTIRRLRGEANALPADITKEVVRLRERYGFMHWHVAFPDVFTVNEAGEDWKGGFDVVLGNPPWERIKLQEKEFFAGRDSAIADAPNAASRRKLIKALEKTLEGQALLEEFLSARRDAEGASHFVRRSGRYPLCGRGDVNTYTIFAETMRAIVAASGRVGCIVPSGVATDDTTKFFFQDLVETGSLVSLYDFENSRGIFQGVHRSYKFSLLTLAGKDRPDDAPADFAFFCLDTRDLLDDERRFTLSAEDIALINPNTKTCPVFRTRRDAEITKAIYRRVPVLVREDDPDGNPWGLSFATMFHMSNDSGLFQTREELEKAGATLDGNAFVHDGERLLPLYEAKMLHHFDHRWATYEGTSTRDVAAAEKADPTRLPLPRYWVPEREVAARLDGKWDRRWLLGWRDICRSTDERTVIADVFPRVGAGHKIPLMMLGPLAASDAATVQAALCSMSLDYVARQKVGSTSLTYFYLKQFAFTSLEQVRQTPTWSDT
ncbi:MAG: Eco57I restriction-modification methylase domain-containing protein, partial [Planctomycetota bacterium JB042]